MALAYVRSASEINQMTDIAFFAHYGETSRIVGFFPNPGHSGRPIFDLHRRHAAAVCSVFDKAIASHAPKLRAGPTRGLLSVPGRQPARGGKCLSLPTSVLGTDRNVWFRNQAGDRHRAEARHFRSVGRANRGQCRIDHRPCGTIPRARDDELAPENYPFTETPKLMGQTRCDNEETLRGRILRCRNKIEELAKSAGILPPSLDAVIENSQWHGYRLNPDRVRLVAVSECPER